jgi:hypothetical protein
MTLTSGNFYHQIPEGQEMIMSHDSDPNNDADANATANRDHSDNANELSTKE